MAFRLGNVTSVRRANGDLPAGDPRMRCDARPVAPTNAALPMGRCSRSYRRSNCSGSVGVGYSTTSLTLMVLPPWMRVTYRTPQLGFDGARHYRESEPNHGRAAEAYGVRVDNRPTTCSFAGSA